MIDWNKPFKKGVLVGYVIGESKQFKDWKIVEFNNGDLESFRPDTEELENIPEPKQKKEGWIIKKKEDELEGYCFIYDNYEKAEDDYRDYNPLNKWEIIKVEWEE